MHKSQTFIICNIIATKVKLQSYYTGVYFQAFNFRPGVIYTFQALSEEDCELWLDAMDGKEPMYVHPPKPGNAHHTYLDEAGFSFITKCFQSLESRGN